MAANDTVQVQRKTYHKLLSTLKYGGIVVLGITFVVLWLISSK